MRNLATALVTATLMVSALATARCAHSGGARAANEVVMVSVVDLDTGEARSGTGWVHAGIVYTAGHMLWGISEDTLGVLVSRGDEVCQIRAMETGIASDVAVLVPDCNLGHGMRISIRPAVVGETLCWTSMNKGVPVENCGEVAEVVGQWIALNSGVLPGHSGAPLYREDGRVVGIISRGGSKFTLAIRIDALEVRP